MIMSRDLAESPASGIAYTLSFPDFFAVRRAVAWNGVFGSATYWIRATIPAVILPVCWAVPVMAALKARGFSHWQLLTVVAVLAGCIALFVTFLALDLLVARLSFGRIALANANLCLRLEADGIHYQTLS